MKFNEIIKALREDADLTQSELAKEFNVNQITISQYERGTRQISLDMLINYAKKFNVSTDYILGLTKNPTPNYDIKNQLNISGQNKIHKIEMKWGINMEQTTIADYNEQIQQAFSDGLNSGLSQGFEIIMPYVIGAVVIVLIGTIIKALFKKSTKRK